jgi:hypothetical protein
MILDSIKFRMATHHCILWKQNSTLLHSLYFCVHEIYLPLSDGAIWTKELFWLPWQGLGRYLANHLLVYLNT